MKIALFCFLFYVLQYSVAQTPNCNTMFLTQPLHPLGDCYNINGFAFCNGTDSYCTMYNNLYPGHCCSTVVDSQLQTQMTIQMVPIFGNASCSNNLKNLFCAWTCGPKSADFITTTLVNSIPNITVYISFAVANFTFYSCKDRCLPYGGGRTTLQQYGNAVTFIQAFSWYSDPSYVPSLSNPYLYYVVGTNPLTNNSIQLTDVSLSPASGADLSGCYLPPKANFAVSNFEFSFFVFVFMFTILLF